MHLVVFTMVCFQALFQFILLFPLIHWQGMCFWTIIYYQLFSLGARGCSFWEIILDPDNTVSTQRKTKKQKPVGTIQPLWARFLVLSTYQVYGIYAHLFQHNNCNVLDPIAQASSPQVPKVWDPLRLVVPYNYITLRLFEPPDCQLQKGLMI